MGLCPPASSSKPVLKENQELLVRQGPILDTHSPLFGDLNGAQVDNLADRIVRREDGLRFRKFAYHAVISLDRVGGVYDLPDLNRIVEEGRQLRPVAVPGF